MIISERIFEKLQELSMTQKEFSQKTGIRQSAISEWKKKHTNPSADKILIICKVLGVTPEWLLSGTDIPADRLNRPEWLVIERKTQEGWLLETYNEMDSHTRERLIGYVEALKGIK